MGEILGIGVTHYPGLIQPDEAMAGLLNRTLNSDQVPDALKDPARWPEPMRKEWADPARRRQGAPAAPGQRLPQGAQGVGRIRPRLRADLGRRPVREFPRGRRPVVLRLRLRRDRIAPLCALRSGATANVWNEGKDTVFHTKGHHAAASTLAAKLIEAGLRHQLRLSHALRKRAAACLYQHDPLSRL